MVTKINQSSQKNPNLYIVFDKLPKKNEGGLVATYVNLVRELKPYYHIELVGVFENGANDITEFSDIPLHTLSNKNIDNRFFKALSYLKKGSTKKFFHAIWSGIYYFAARPILKARSKELLKDKIVIASSPAAAMFLSRKVKYILEIHTSFEYFWGNNLLGRMQSMLIPPATITVFRNKHDMEKAQKLFPSTYIYNAFDTKGLPPINLEQTNSCSALFVARLAPEKDPLRLLRLTQKVKESLPEFTLDIYGDGPLFDTLQEKILAMDLGKTVRLCGFVDDKSIYQHYDLLWVTSKFEGFGLVIIEAMANGTPCVSTNWGDAVTEIIDHEKTGYIASTDQKFIEYSIDILSNNSARQKLANAALASFQDKFTCDINTKEWIDLLKLVYPNE